MTDRAIAATLEDREEYLFEMLIQWRRLAMELEQLEKKMTPIMEILKKTITIGRAEAKYFPGRRVFDYRIPGLLVDEEIQAKHTETIVDEIIDWRGISEFLNASPDDIKKFTTVKTTVTTDWKKVCKDAGVEPFVKSPGTVKISYNLK